jgi:phosphohistidine phosphatase
VHVLVILRHAKTANPDGVADINRPLTRRGRADAVAAGEWLAAREYTPDLVLCSPSRRTRETWHGVAGALTRAPEVSYVEDIYAADVDDVLAVVNGADPAAGTLLLIGHNPSLSQLSALLDPVASADEGLATAGIAVHTVDGDWADLAHAPLAAAHTARAAAAP